MPQELTPELEAELVNLRKLRDMCESTINGFRNDVANGVLNSLAGCWDYLLDPVVQDIADTAIQAGANIVEEPQSYPQS